jgi:hypothetical protein
MGGVSRRVMGVCPPAPISLRHDHANLDLGSVDPDGVYIDATSSGHLKWSTRIACAIEFWVTTVRSPNIPSFKSHTSRHRCDDALRTRHTSSGNPDGSTRVSVTDSTRPRRPSETLRPRGDILRRPRASGSTKRACGVDQSHLRKTVATILACIRHRLS